jgi:hypothetical protein
MPGVCGTPRPLADPEWGGDAAMSARRILCGDRVVTPDGWTGRVVAQHGHYSWVSMEATNSPQTWGTSALKPVENPDA